MEQSSIRQATENPKKANKNKNFVKLVYARGKADGVTARDLLIEISEKSKLPLRKFGKISCFAHCTRIEAPEGSLRQILRAFNTDGEELLKIDEGKQEKESVSERPRRERRSFSGEDKKSTVAKKTAAKKSEAPKAPRRKLRDMFSEWENEAAWNEPENTIPAPKKKLRRIAKS